MSKVSEFSLCESDNIRSTKIRISFSALKQPPHPPPPRRESSHIYPIRYICVPVYLNDVWESVK